MRRRSGKRTISLPAQLIFVFVLLAILNALLVGLPAIWIIHNQLDRQAWALIDQGISTTQALLASKQKDLLNLAILTAQRPSLHQLVAAGEPQPLNAYLKTLETAAGLDLVAVCTGDGEPIAWAGAALPGMVCNAAGEQTLLTDTSKRPAVAWALSAYPIQTENAVLGSVVVGILMDDGFARQLRSQTGLEQILVSTGELTATSFDQQGDATTGNQALLAALKAGIQVEGAIPSRATRVTIQNSPYYTASFPVGDSGLMLIIALPVAGLLDTQRQLTWLVVAGVFAVAVLGSALGILIARQIGRPLSRLEGAASTFRMGDLTTPVPLGSRVREVSQVAYALEDARSTLQHTLQQLRKEKDWIQHLMESIVEGVVALDQFGRITYFSRGAERITGLDSGSVQLRSCDDVFHPVEEGAKFNQFIPPPGQRQKVALRLADGRQITVALTGARLAPPESGRSRLALVLRDVSDEEAVRRLLGDFMANIIHEFRTPLSALAVSVELLIDQLPDLTQAELHELLNSTQLGILDLQNLIDNLLEGASLETGRFRVYPQPTPLTDILTEAERAVRPLLEKNRVRLRTDLPQDLPVVKADLRRTGQVLINLLSNAIKVGPQGSEITISVQVEGEQARVAITDQGPGIPTERLPELFTRFVHLDSDDRSVSGAGLGLSVVKAIIEAQGGQVGARNGANGGAIFWFTLPLAERIPA